MLVVPAFRNVRPGPGESPRCRRPSPVSSALWANPGVGGIATFVIADVIGTPNHYAPSVSPAGHGNLFFFFFSKKNTIQVAD